MAGAFTPEIHTTFGTPTVLGLWAFLLILLGAFAVRLNPTGESLLSLAVENEDLEDRIESGERTQAELNTAIGLLTFQTGYSISARAAVLLHARRQLTDLASFRSAIEDLVVPLSFQSEYLFDLGPSEAWSFAVYLYSAERDILVPVWRKKAQNHPSPAGNMGREWGRGEGHVGKAFVDQKSIITGNTNEPEAAQFSAVPKEKALAYDGAYVSFASVPIGPILAEDSRPYGVLVGTSNRANRFNRDNAGILIQIAGAIASLLITGVLDVDKFLPRPGSTQDEEEPTNGAVRE